MSTLAELQSQLDDLKGQLARLREETSLFFIVHRDEQGQVTDTQLKCWLVNCEMIQLRTRDGQHCGGIIGTDEEGSYVSLWDKTDKVRAIMRVTGESGEFELIGQDRQPLVRVFEHEGHGHVGVFSEGNVPRVIMKGMETGGTVTAVDEAGKPLALVNSMNGKGSVLVLGDNQVQAQMTTNEAGGFISTATADGKKSCVIASAPTGNTILLSTPDGGAGISLGATDEGTILSIGADDRAHGSGSVTLSELPNLGGSIVVRDRENRQALDLSSDERGGSIRVIGAEGEHASIGIGQSGACVSVAHRNGTSEAAMIAVESGGLLAARGGEGASAIVNVGEGGGSFTLVKGEHVQFFAGLAEDKESGLISLNAPDNTCLARLATAPQGGVLLLSGRDGTVQAGLGAGEAGGTATVFSELGVERATLRSADDGGGLHLKWGGTTGIVAAATERGGIVTAHAADGKIVEMLPRRVSFDDEEEDES